MKPLFTLGRLVATPGALAAIGVLGDDLSTFLARHQSGDWGDIDADDRKENQLSVEHELFARRTEHRWACVDFGGEDGDYS